MARKTLKIKISKEGRDFGKVFFIQEHPAMQQERWAIRAFLALARTGAEIPEDVTKMGMAGIVALGLGAFSRVDYLDLEPLLAEMLTCVSIIPNPAMPDVMRTDIENDIEEVSTLLLLRQEAFYLASGFTRPIVPLK